MRKLLVCTALTLLATAASAQAAITQLDYGIAPASPPAGGAPDVSITTAFAYDDPADDVKDVSVRLPPGLLGNPQAAARCAPAQFAADTCPAESDVGDVTVAAIAQPLPPLVEVGTSSKGDVYNLEPTGSEPARIGVIVRASDPVLNVVPLEKILLQAPAELVRVGDGFALETTFRDIGRSVGGVPIRITSFTQTFSGSVNGRPFMRMPTSCAAAVGTASADSYNAPAAPATATATATVTPTGCDTLAFAPKIEGTIGAPGFTGQGAKPPLTTVLRFDPSQAALKTATVTLPPFMSPNVAASARACPDAAYAAGNCPASSRAGSAVAESPLSLQPLTGPVTIVGNPGTLPKVGVQLNGVVSLSLVGTVSLSTKGVTTTFTGSPDLPLSAFTLNFDRDGLLQNGRDLCGSGLRATTTGVLGAHSGATANVSGDLRVVGCSGTTSKAKKKARRPRARGTLRVDRAGDARLSAAVAAAPTAPKLRRVRLTLPRGIAGASTKTRSAVTVKAGGKRVAAKRVRVGKRAIVVRLPHAAKRVTIGWARLHVSPELQRKLKAKPRTRLRVGVRVTDASGKRWSVPLKIKPKRTR